MSSRRWRSAAVVMALTAVLVAPALAPPAGASETTFTDTCEEVYGHKPVGDLEKTTDPSAGNAVASGETVAVGLSWPSGMVAGNRAHRVLECLSIDGGAPQQWAERQFTTDQGAVTLSAVVPAGLSDKSTVCSQTFLKTAGSFGPVTRWSEKTCFPVGSGSFHALSRMKSPPADRQSQPESRNNSTPTTRGPLFSPSPSPPSSSKPYSPPSGRGDYEAPWPPWEKAPRVAAAPPVTTPTTSKATTPTTRKAQGTQVAAPASQGQTSQPSQTLPRTGAGVVVLLAIAAVVLFSGRTLRKTAQHIEDNLPVEALPIDDDDDEPTLVLGRRW